MWARRGTGQCDWQNNGSQKYPYANPLKWIKLLYMPNRTLQIWLTYPPWPGKIVLDIQVGPIQSQESWRWKGGPEEVSDAMQEEFDSPVQTLKKRARSQGVPVAPRSWKRTE